MSPARRIANWFAAHENRIFCSSLMGGSVAVVFSLFVLWSGDAFSPRARWTVSLLVLGCWLGYAFSARERVVNPLRTLANLLEALHEGDYSIRGRLARPDDALGEVMLQINAMAATLRSQRLGAVEAATLLAKVMEEIDVAVFTFDASDRLRLVNRAGERLLAQPKQRLLARTAGSLDLAEFLHTEDVGPVTRAFPGGSGRWGIRRTSFRERGLPHTLLVVSDLTRALREEEVQAWQRIVRVLGHELNNSLTPIQSIAGSLSQLFARTPRPADWEDDMRSGLAVIGARSESLSRFIGSYSRLAKLPRPTFGPVDLHTLVQRAANLEIRLPVNVIPGPPLTLRADSDQLEQLLINLIRNATDASLETGGAVTVTWIREHGHALVFILDDGLGLSNTANLFVPFFTTKPGGSGIGLVLCRQIAEAHLGSLTLSNRAGVRGCQARLTLPL
ncbi:MAG: PAS domain-containing sensor histidine kinase [Acidobacteria bacterium]|nr:PAS domain-containing sensor histidine kinase [Acidobacteriota bacterium]